MRSSTVRRRQRPPARRPGGRRPRVADKGDRSVRRACRACGPWLIRMRKIQVLRDERPSKSSSPRITPNQVSWTTSSAADGVCTNVRATRRSAPSCRSTSARNASSSPACRRSRRACSSDTACRTYRPGGAQAMNLVRRPQPGSGVDVSSGGHRRDDLIDAVDDHGVDERADRVTAAPVVGVVLAALEVGAQPDASFRQAGWRCGRGSPCNPRVVTPRASRPIVPRRCGTPPRIRPPAQRGAGRVRCAARSWVPSSARSRRTARGAGRRSAPPGSPGRA